DHPRASRHRVGADRSEQMGSSDQPACREGRPRPCRRRQSAPSLRASRGGRPRAAGTGDSSRGLPVIDRRRLVVVLVTLTAGLMGGVAAAALIGSARIAAADIVAVLFGRADPHGTESVVILGVRLPRIAAAVLAGGALAVAGAGFQALTRNPLAEPSVLGVSGGAAFGVVGAQVSGLGPGGGGALWLAALGVAGAVAAGAAALLLPP